MPGGGRIRSRSGNRLRGDALFLARKLFRGTPARAVFYVVLGGRDGNGVLVSVAARRVSLRVVSLRNDVFGRSACADI